MCQEQDVHQGLLMEAAVRCGFSAILQLRASKPAAPGKQPWPSGKELLGGELLSTAPLKQPNLVLTTPYAVKGKQYTRAPTQT